MTRLAVLPVAAKASVEQGLEAALESALAHWLYHDEIWLRGNAKAQSGNSAGDSPRAPCPRAVRRHRAA
ncbi:adenylate cyclase [Klebsiella pneumoniae]|uniref:Adenylate cyclase n=1 Tax=Klebsiella pneumoniae TaxID=573 RepID=A0A2X3CH36_KLEPN|nr:adenylate cyclase [Klebsiella pneumoniae]